MATKRICSVDGCIKNVTRKTYCEAHHLRYRRHGDPLKGGPMRVTAKTALRWIHSVAIPFQGTECLIWPFQSKSHGYGSITVDGRHTSASRYICEIFHGEPPTPLHHSAHSCGRGHEGCISPGHLGWKTHQQNQDDKKLHGTILLGRKNPSAKLTEPDVVFILSSDASLGHLARMFGVSKTQISRVKKKLAWGWITA
jgi:hypothetical protein